MSEDEQARFKRLRRQQIDEARAYTTEAVERLAWPRERVLAEQTRRLRKVVADAKRGSAFHAERLAHVDADTLDAADLTALPYMTKHDVMDHWDQLVTDKRLRLDAANQHLNDLQEGRTRNPCYLDEYFIFATGGSSGKRGVFVWDREMMVVAPNLTYRMEAAADLADPPSGPRRTACICAGSFVHGSRILFPVTVDPQRESRVFPANLPIDEMVDRLNAYQPDRLIGYSTMIEEMARQALDGKLTITPNRVSTNSEPLFPEAREAVREAWGLGVHDGWGSVEIGLAATEGDSFAGMSLTEDFCIFEPVDADDQPVTDLEQADRLLVTRLYGSAMPMIRYEMTDTCIIDDGPNPDAPGYRRIREIKGRADAWFVYPGNVKVHPMTFRGVLGQVHSISEYQVRQTSAGADVQAITHGAFDSADVQRKLIAALNAAGLADARITVESTPSLPRHPQTNKLTPFVPLTY